MNSYATLSADEKLALDLKSLRNDLKCAWDYRNSVTVQDADGNLSQVESKDAMFRLRMSTEYIGCIDPQSMIFLKLLFKRSPFNYSMVSLAADVMACKSYAYIMVDGDPFSNRQRKSY